MALTHYQTLVDSLVRDDSGITEAADRNDAIDLAVIRYNDDRPDETVEDVVSSGGQYLDLPTAWEANFSVLKSIEFPIGNVPPTHLQSGAYGMYNSPAALQVMVRDALASGDTVRMTFTTQHTVDTSSDTPPVKHRQAIASWAAGILCEQLAGFYSGEGDSTISADAVNHQSRAREYATRAKALYKAYFDALGIDPKRNVAAGVVVDLDLPNSQGNDRLTHPARYR